MLRTSLPAIEDAVAIVSRRPAWLSVVLALGLGGCAASGGATSAGPTDTASPATGPVTTASQGQRSRTPSAIPPSPTPGATPTATLATTFEMATVAPTGAIHLRMTVIDGNPRYVPTEITAKAGTVVFFLENVPGPLFEVDHNMRIGRDVDTTLAGTPHLRAHDSALFTVNDIKPGTYVFSCSVIGANNQPHSYYGMVGTLTITP